VKGPLPAGVSVRVLDWPEMIDVGDATGAGADGGVQVTVTTAVLLFTDVLQPLTFTQ
jgi:hypothetical protein